MKMVPLAGISPSNRLGSGLVWLKTRGGARQQVIRWVKR
jgi:hypothetical protein